MTEIEDGDLPEDDELEEELEETATTIALRDAIGRTVDALVAAEDIEVNEGASPQLVEELLLVALDATTSKQMLRKLRGALFRSDHVADVFASDIRIEQVFRAALGG